MQPAAQKRKESRKAAAAAQLIHNSKKVSPYIWHDAKPSTYLAQYLTAASQADADVEAARLHAVEHAALKQVQHDEKEKSKGEKTAGKKKKVRQINFVWGKVESLNSHRPKKNLKPLVDMLSNLKPQSKLKF